MMLELARVFATEAAELADRLNAAVADAASSTTESGLAETRRLLHSFKGAAHTAGFTALGDLAHALEGTFAAGRVPDAPAFERVRAALAAIEGALQEIASSGKEPNERLTRARESVLLTEGAAPPAAVTPAPRENESVGRVDLLALEGIAQRILAARTAAERLSRGLRAAALTSPELGEFAAASRELLRALADANRDSAKLRLRPVGALLASARATFADALARTGKRGRLVCAGEDVLLDRRISSDLQAALAHAVRNAVDHGFERADERAAAGKSDLPTLTVRAAARGIRVELAIEDDGRGIDLEAVRGAAIERGLVAPDEEASPEQLERLVFLPGFSTRATVTETSGRGVGLDVVRDTVERLNGRVRLRSTPGRGTQLALEVPVSLASARSLVVARAGQRFAIPLVAATRILTIEKIGVTGGRPTIETEGERCLLLDLAASFCLPAPGEPAQAVLVEVGDRRVALGVDAVIEETELTVRPVGEPLGRLPCVAGLAFAGEELVPILELAELMRSAPRDARPKAPPASVAAPSKPDTGAKSVLVVDDSITTRTLEENILTLAGYRVRTAVNGVEALAALDGGGIDLVITDLEMPGIDGLELLRRMAADPALAALPAIMVSSRAESREQALRAGARSYVVKRAFDQEQLVDEVARLLSG
jgi:two-component system chemotaxis sensor kinase CheA